MIRLYWDKEFQEKDRIRLPKDEIRYYQSVRRAQGEVRLFNRFGQEASGYFEGKDFVVEAVHLVSTPTHAVRVALALPDAKVLKQIFPQLSEMGVQALSVFEAERSQAARTRKIDISSKWEKRAIESARQCGRGIPIQMEWASLDELLEHHHSESWNSLVFDECSSEEAGPPFSLFESSPIDCVFVGPEGGWTEAERQRFQKAGIPRFHVKAPIMKVETAALVAASLAVLTQSCGASISQK